MRISFAPTAVRSNPGAETASGGWRADTFGMVSARLRPCASGAAPVATSVVPPGSFGAGALGLPRCRHRLKLPDHPGPYVGDAAVHLHARPPEPVRREASLGEMVAYRVVVGLLAAMLQQDRMAHAPVREVAGEGIEEQPGRVIRPAALGVHERDEARHVAPRRRIPVEVLCDEAGHLA